MSRHAPPQPSLTRPGRAVALVVATAGVLAFAPAGAGQDPARIWPEAGATLSLPRSWDWQADRGLGLKSAVAPAEGEPREISCELRFVPGALIGPRLKKLVERDGAATSSISVKSGDAFAGKQTIVVTRTEGASVLTTITRRHHLFRRGGNLYEWIEDEATGLATRAKPAFADARQALRFGVPAGADSAERERDLVFQKLRYCRDEDWLWAGGTVGEKVEIEQDGVETVFPFRIVSEVLVGDEVAPLDARLWCHACVQPVSTCARGVGEGARRSATELKDHRIAGSRRLAGIDAYEISFTGIPVDPELRQGDHRMAWSIHVFRHASNAFLWTEVCRVKDRSAAAAAFQKARAGLKPY